MWVWTFGRIVSVCQLKVSFEAAFWPLRPCGFVQNHIASLKIEFVALMTEFNWFLFLCNWRNAKVKKDFLFSKCLFWLAHTKYQNWPCRTKQSSPDLTQLSQYARFGRRSWVTKKVKRSLADFKPARVAAVKRFRDDEQHCSVFYSRTRTVQQQQQQKRKMTLILGNMKHISIGKSKLI